MIYYEFDRTGNGGKYKEMTEAGYKMAAQDHRELSDFLEMCNEVLKNSNQHLSFERDSVNSSNTASILPTLQF